MIITSDISELASKTEMIDFYKGRFDHVDVVVCSKCKEQLALELMGGDPMGLSFNDVGKIVVPLSDKLISHRVRLDEAPTGEPMMGYQCACGNDTRISKIEEEYLPETPANRGPTTLDPFTKQKLKETIRLRKDHKPKFRKQGNAKHFETFKVERIK
jgi:predicted GH43/DUF377 family glycosyl hydrolase